MLIYVDKLASCTLCVCSPVTRYHIWKNVATYYVTPVVFSLFSISIEGLGYMLSSFKFSLCRSPFTHKVIQILELSLHSHLLFIMQNLSTKILLNMLEQVDRTSDEICEFFDDQLLNEHCHQLIYPNKVYREDKNYFLSQISTFIVHKNVLDNFFQGG